MLLLLIHEDVVFVLSECFLKTCGLLLCYYFKWSDCRLAVNKTAGNESLSNLFFLNMILIIDLTMNDSAMSKCFIIFFFTKGHRTNLCNPRLLSCQLQAFIDICLHPFNNRWIEPNKFPAYFFLLKISPQYGIQLDLLFILLHTYSAS